MRTKLASCLGKSSFSTWAQAEQRAKTMRRRGERGLRPYRCDFGAHYHVGGASIKIAPRQTFARKPTRVRIDSD